jgi:hypothetical protein
MYLQRDGVTLFTLGIIGGVSGAENLIVGGGMETATIKDVPSAGSHTYTLYVGTSSGSVYCKNRCITYIEAKR